jgi:hypothetical protein
MNGKGLTHSLPLPHSLTHSLPSLTHSLTHSLIRMLSDMTEEERRFLAMFVFTACAGIVLFVAFAVRSSSTPSLTHTTTHSGSTTTASSSSSSSSSSSGDGSHGPGAAVSSKSVTPTLAHSPTHSPTLSLTHSLTHSLTPTAQGRKRAASTSVEDMLNQLTVRLLCMHVLQYLLQKKCPVS